MWVRRLAVLQARADGGLGQGNGGENGEEEGLELVKR